MGRPSHKRFPAVGRGKILDNLRRSLFAPFTLATIAVSWLLPLPMGVRGTLLALAAIAVPAFLPPLLAILPRRAGVRLGSHLRSLGGDLRLAVIQTVLSTAFLPDQAWRMGDAIVRTMVRLFVTRRHLLEWTTAAQSTASPRLDLLGFYRGMASGTLLGLLVAAGALALAPSSWPIALPVALLWLGAPMLASLASRQPSVAPAHAVSGVRGTRSSPRRAADMALLRDVRHRRGQHAAAGQFPGDPEAGHRPSDVADQHRSLPALRRRRARLRLGGNEGDRRTPGGDVRIDAEAPAIQGAFSSIGMGRRICARSIPPTCHPSTAGIWPAI